MSAVAAGLEHTCAIRTAEARCWGNGEYGQLGDGLTLNRSTPVLPAGLGTGMLSNAAGARHSCAIQDNSGTRRAWCLGDNSFGQLGNNSRLSSDVPVLVAVLPTDVSRIATGSYHSCAATRNGVMCWGANGSGQLGDGTLFDKQLPVAVQGLPTWTAQDLSLGDAHSCAVVNNEWSSRNLTCFRT